MAYTLYICINRKDISVVRWIVWWSMYYMRHLCTICIRLYRPYIVLYCAGGLVDDCLISEIAGCCSLWRAKYTVGIAPAAYRPVALGAPGRRAYRHWATLWMKRRYPSLSSARWRHVVNLGHIDHCATPPLPWLLSVAALTVLALAAG